jgi:hypothetical protein
MIFPLSVTLKLRRVEVNFAQIPGAVALCFVI